MKLAHKLLNAWLQAPDHPAKLRIADYVVSRFQGSLETTYFDARFFVPPGDLIGKHILLHGGFERQTIKTAMELLNGGGTFVDVGANFGLFSVILSEDPSVRCCAIEPDHDNFALLMRNLALNNRRNVSAINCAVSDAPGLLAMRQLFEGNRGTVRPVVSGPVAAENEGTRWVGALSLDAILDTLEVDRIDCLKIDVEGYEFEVLKNIDWASKRRPRAIICEYMKCPDPYFGKDHFDVFRLLTEAGYEPFDVTGAPLHDVHRDTMPPEYNILYRSRM